MLDTRDKIIADELRSFIACYAARIASLKSSREDDILWEGEMHLLPALNLNNTEKLKNIMSSKSQTDLEEFCKPLNIKRSYIHELKNLMVVNLSLIHI